MYNDDDDDDRHERDTKADNRYIDVHYYDFYDR